MTFTLYLKNDSQLKVVDHEGSGVHMHGKDAGRYELHITELDGSQRFIFQDQILKVCDEDGNEVDWGNPNFPDHPHFRNIDRITQSVRWTAEWFPWAAERFEALSRGEADNDHLTLEESQVSILWAALSQIDSLENDIALLAEVWGVKDVLAQKMANPDDEDGDVLEFVPAEGSG